MVFSVSHRRLSPVGHAYLFRSPTDKHTHAHVRATHNRRQQIMSYDGRDYRQTRKTVRPPILGRKRQNGNRFLVNVHGRPQNKFGRKLFRKLRRPQNRDAPPNRRHNARPGIVDIKSGDKSTRLLVYLAIRGL